MVWTNLLLGILEVFIMAGSMYYFMSRIRHEIERKKWEYLLVFFLYGCLTFAIILVEQNLNINMLTITFTLVYGMIVGCLMFSKKNTIKI